jgi:hypothetical protein
MVCVPIPDYRHAQRDSRQRRYWGADWGRLWHGAATPPIKSGVGHGAGNDSEFGTLWARAGVVVDDLLLYASAGVAANSKQV